MDFKKQKPIYLQIADQLMDRVLSGEYRADDRMPSVRDVATMMGVNPNTVVRSFDYLQQQQVIYQRRGVGYFVDGAARDRVLALYRREFLDEELPAIRQRVRLLGLSLEEVLKDDNPQKQQPI